MTITDLPVWLQWFLGLAVGLLVQRLVAAGVVALIGLLWRSPSGR